MSDVVVLDQIGQIISKTKPAMARKLLKNKEAEIVFADPFVIKLTKNANMQQFGGNKMGLPVNIHGLLSKGEQPLYLQNVSGGIVSIEFRYENQIIPFRLANVREPICITDAIPWNVIKNDYKFRELLNRENVGKPKWVTIMTQPEYDAYLERRSEILNQSKEELVNRSTTAHGELNNKPDVSTTPEERKDNLRDEVKDKDILLDDIEIINPKLLGTCQRLHPESDSKIDPIDALDMFESMADSFTENDFNYIISHSYNDIIKKWALKKQLTEEEAPSLATSNTIIRETEDLRDTPSVITKSKKRTGRPKKSTKKK